MVREFALSLILLGLVMALGAQSIEQFQIPNIPPTGGNVNPYFSQILSRNCADGHGYKEGDRGDRRRTVGTMEVSDRA